MQIFIKNPKLIPQNPRFGAFIRLLIASRVHSIRNQLIGEALKLADLVSHVFFQKSSIYILSTYDVSLDELLIISQQYVPKRSGVMMTLAMQLREEGEKKGIKKGIKKGVKKGAEKGIDIALKILSKYGLDSMFLVSNVKFIVSDDSIKKIAAAVDHAETMSELHEMIILIQTEEMERNKSKKNNKNT